MSLPPVHHHLGMTSQLLSLHSEPAIHRSVADYHSPGYYPNAPICGPRSPSAGPCGTQPSRTVATTSQIHFMPALQAEQRDAAGPYTIDPFIDGTKKVGPTSFGVLKIRNIPYDVTRSEIVQFLGKNPQMIENHAMGCAVHIIMERPTSKTMDCFVEFQTLDSVYDQIRSHDNMVESGRHPKLGSRHVHVELSDQNELLAEMFPRAKSIIWEDGAPAVVTNDDPYSTGFKGFFTREEMVGLVRHAECPQRSPFSINCLQRTFECMISTLYKFPWYAAELFTLADRNLLFSTYMSQMCVLVPKVQDKNTKGLDENLLRDFIFAGMNCPGFGERQKHELLWAAGYWGAAIDNPPLRYFWPFDLLGWQDGIDAETVKFFLHLVERGVEVFGNELPFKERLVVRLPLPAVALCENPHFFNNTQFHFDDDSQHLDYGTAMGMERRLMQDLLKAGYASLDEQSPDAGSGRDPGRLVERWGMLQLQRDEMLPGYFEEELTSRPPISPAQSPRGTTAAIPDAGGTIELTPTGRTSKQIDPASKPFEPRRRLSEPQQPPPAVRDSPGYPPLRRRTSSTLSIPFPEDSPATDSPHKRIDYVTPTKIKRLARVSVDHTIHEEDDEDLFLTINRTSIPRNA